MANDTLKIIGVTYGVRGARSADIPVLSALEKECFSGPWSEKTLSDVVSDDGILVAVVEASKPIVADVAYDSIDADGDVETVDTDTGTEKTEADGKIVGYIIADMRVDGEAELQRIAVKGEWRGIGVAKPLMEWMLRAAEESGKDVIFLEVRESNAPAIGLYLKYGFVKTGLRRGYYRFPTENAVLMERELK